MSARLRRVAGAAGVTALLSLPLPAADYVPGGAAAAATSDPGSASSSHRTAAPSHNEADKGQALYSTYCAACHQPNGEGVAGVFPPLKGSAVVNRADATKHIDVVLRGLQGARVSGVTYTNPMPAFAATLSDADITAIVDYERGAWGNHGALITSTQVAGERARSKDTRLLRSSVWVR